MRAYKCDRCGKFFDHSKDAKEPLIFITGSRTSNMYIQDLCDDCQNELDVWWMMGKKKEEVEDEQASGKEKTEKAD